MKHNVDIELTEHLAAEVAQHLEADLRRMFDTGDVTPQDIAIKAIGLIDERATDTDTNHAVRWALAYALTVVSMDVATTRGVGSGRLMLDIAKLIGDTIPDA